MPLVFLPTDKSVGGSWGSRDRKQWGEMLSSGGGRKRIARGRDRQPMSRFFSLLLAQASASALIRVIDTTGAKR